MDISEESSKKDQTPPFKLADILKSEFQLMQGKYQPHNFLPNKVRCGVQDNNINIQISQEITRNGYSNPARNLLAQILIKNQQLPNLNNNNNLNSLKQNNRIHYKQNSNLQRVYLNLKSQLDHRAKSCQQTRMSQKTNYIQEKNFFIPGNADKCPLKYHKKSYRGQWRYNNYYEEEYKQFQQVNNSIGYDLNTTLPQKVFKKNEEEIKMMLLKKYYDDKYESKFNVKFNDTKKEQFQKQVGSNTLYNQVKEKQQQNQQQSNKDEQNFVDLNPWEEIKSEYDYPEIQMESINSNNNNQNRNIQIPNYLSQQQSVEQN